MDTWCAGSHAQRTVPPGSADIDPKRALSSFHDMSSASSGMMSHGRLQAMPERSVLASAMVSHGTDPVASVAAALLGTSKSEATALRTAMASAMSSHPEATSFGSRKRLPKASAKAARTQIGAFSSAHAHAKCDDPRDHPLYSNSSTHSNPAMFSKVGTAEGSFGLTPMIVRQSDRREEAPVWQWSCC